MKWKNTYSCLPGCPHWCICHFQEVPSDSKLPPLAGAPWHSSQWGKPQPTPNYHCCPLAIKQTKTQEVRLPSPPFFSFLVNNEGQHFKQLSRSMTYHIFRWITGKKIKFPSLCILQISLFLNKTAYKNFLQ